MMIWPSCSDYCDLYVGVGVFVLAVVVEFAKGALASSFKG